ncbi:MAG: HIT domain-containing protein [Sphingomonas sp.]|nr:HIT domain-containing protein [Sphingomonas sp.]
MPGCIFCSIAAGEISAAIVFRDEQLVAFMDSSPIRRGHVQIVPRAHFETFDVLPPELLNRMSLLAQRLAARLKQMTGVERVAFLFTGGDVPHAHAHVLPMVEATDITSGQYILPPKPQLSSAHLRQPLDELRAVAREIGEIRL